MKHCLVFMFQKQLRGFITNTTTRPHDPTNKPPMNIRRSCCEKVCACTARTRVAAGLDVDLSCRIVARQPCQARVFSQQWLLNSASCTFDVMDGSVKPLAPAHIVDSSARPEAHKVPVDDSSVSHPVAG